MKMVKSLLLGSAAGLVAVTAGQAADLPVKARAVQYVKVCSLYGAGFYYMPGTDMCIKIGGWVRAEMRWDENSSSSTGNWNGQLNNRLTNNWWWRARGYITADAREQTAYGVARGYIAVGVSGDSAAAFSSNRAFVQWAGFTAGIAVSFYDFYPAAAFMINAGQTISEDTGDGGQYVWGYTAQFGGGLSATIAAEQPRQSQIINVIGTGGTGSFPGSAFTASTGYGGLQSPDWVANLRVDQTWGSAQIMGALHLDNAQYYATSGSSLYYTSGHPNDRWGWVVGAGLKLNAPQIAAGDYLDVEVNYTQGATKYLDNASSGKSETNVMGGDMAWGVGSDCVFNGATASSCELTTAWSVNAGFEHYWTPQWHQSLVGAYMAKSYDAAANAYLCTYESGTAGCNNNWSAWEVGSRLQWDVTKSFYLAVDALYTHLDSATNGTNFVPTKFQPSGYGTLATSDEGNWLFGMRMHKDFLP